MDFDSAISAHAEWKMKLKKYIAKPDKSLNPTIIGTDSECNLGKWLHGEGQKFASLPEYKTLVDEHAKFHKVAASIIIRADKGEKVQDEVALGAKSEFSTSSSKVVSLIMHMKTKVK